MQKASGLLKRFAENEFDKRLLQLYVDRSLLEKQRQRYISAVNEFINKYGDVEVEIYSAPGRSEVGGNHTDHQRGMVLATAVNMDVIAVVEKTSDTKVSVFSEGYGETNISVEQLDVVEEEKGTTAALIRGVLSELKKRGFNIGGFNAYITSQVPEGAGLSSSAAFETLIGNIISGLFNDMKIDAVTIAQVGQYAENMFFDKPCGLMDQMASSVGGLIFIDFMDKHNPVVEKVEVDFDSFEHSLCIVDTKGSHANLTDEYAAIPGEMKSVAEFFGVDVLRQVDKEEFYKMIPVFRSKVGDRAVIRAIHFYKEEDKVIALVKALNEGDFKKFKDLINKSGDSSYKYLQNVYSVKDSRRQEMGLALALSEEILGEDCTCRVHGGGFAGTIQAFVPNERVVEYKKRIEEVYGPGACHVLKVRAFGGERVI